MASEPKPATGTATVTVASKLQIGMRCVIHEERQVREVTLGGYRDVKQSFPTGREFTIRGTAHGQNEGPRCRIVAGFAITPGIPKDLWDAWREQNASLPAIQGRMIFAYENESKSLDAAKENRRVTTGLERINPNKLPTFDNRFEIKTAEEQVVKPQISEEAA